jgi:hypothetical protein
MPIAISPNKNVTATDCQKVMIEADQATIYRRVSKTETYEQKYCGQPIQQMTVIA